MPDLIRQHLEESERAMADYFAALQLGHAEAAALALMRAERASSRARRAARGTP